MLENSLYNLMIQMVEENKCLWRIKNMYKKDARHCDRCEKFWQNLETEKEQRVGELRELIKIHI
jgi:hypothetical protein